MAEYPNGLLIDPGYDASVPEFGVTANS